MKFENNIFTSDFFIKRIPFFVDFKLKENPYKDYVNGFEHSIDFSWEQKISRPSVLIDGTEITFSRVNGFSDFSFVPHYVYFRGKQVKDLIELQFNLRNQIIFTVPLNLSYSETAKVNRFIEENKRVCNLLSYSYHSTGGGIIQTDSKGNFDKTELDVIINKINEKLFKFEEYMGNFGLTY